MVINKQLVVDLDLIILYWESFRGIVSIHVVSVMDSHRLNAYHVKIHYNIMIRLLHHAMINVK